jgi:hypothetical protein
VRLAHAIAEELRIEWGLSGAQTLTVARKVEAAQKAVVEAMARQAPSLVAAPLTAEQVEHTRERILAVLR